MLQSIGTDTNVNVMQVNSQDVSEPKDCRRYS
jgi:hypothetical protein